MCLAIPMEIIELEGEKAVVSRGGLKVRADVRFIDRPRKGDYVMVHAGFAIERVKPERAKEILEYVREMEELK